MDFKQIQELIKLVNKSNLSELTIEEKDFKVTIKQKEEIIQQLDEKQIKTSPSIQGSDWPDYPILKANHFRVLGSGDFDAMFKMLSAKRIDYFPRSVTEIWPELQQKTGKTREQVVDWLKSL